MLTPQPQHPNFYAIIPASVRYDDRLSDAAKLFYGELAALTTEKGYCWARNRGLSAKYQVSRRTISTWVALLEKTGHIRVEVLNRNYRRVYLTACNPGTSRAKKTSNPHEADFQPDGSQFPSLYSITENNKENTHSVSSQSRIRQKRSLHPQVETFIELWSAAHEDFFGVSYKVQERKDQRAATDLLELSSGDEESSIGMPHPGRDRSEIHSLFYQLGGLGVTQAVEAEARDAAFLAGALK